MEPGPSQPVARPDGRGAKLIRFGRTSAVLILQLSVLFLQLVGVVSRAMFRLAVAGAEAIAARLAGRRAG